MQKNMGNWRKDAEPMDVLQAFVAALAGYYNEKGTAKEISHQRAINLIAKVPTIVASWDRIRNSKEHGVKSTARTCKANDSFILK